MTLEESQPQEAPLKLIHLIGLVGLLVLVLVAVFVALRGAGLFLLLLAPPEPPKPEHSVMVRHNSPYFGRDEWEYTTPHDVLSITEFYELQGATCAIESVCGADQRSTLGDAVCSQHQAVCQGQFDSASTNILWEAEIVPIGISGIESELKLYRLIDWSGTTSTTAPD